MQIVEIFVTAKNKREAEKITRTLLKKHLIACANIVPSISSVYWWKGKICNEKECLTIMKTRKTLAKKVIARVKLLHSYAVPQANVVPVLEGNADYIKWVWKETKQ